MLSMTSSTTRRWPSGSQESFSLESVLDLEWRCRVEARLPKLFVTASYQKELDTRSMTRTPIIVGYEGMGGRARTESRTLLVYAGHRLTKCNVGLMNLVGNGPKHVSRHGCLIIVLTGPRGPVQYNAVNDTIAHLKVAQLKLGAFQPRICPSP